MWTVAAISKLVGLCLGLAATQCLVCIHQMNQVNSCNSCHNDSTINVIWLLLLLLLLLCGQQTESSQLFGGITQSSSEQM